MTVCPNSLKFGVVSMTVHQTKIKIWGASMTGSPTIQKSSLDWNRPCWKHTQKLHSNLIFCRPFFCKPFISTFALVVPGGSCWLLIAPGGSWWLLVAPFGSWWLLVAPGGSWWLLVAPGGSWGSCGSWGFLRFIGAPWVSGGGGWGWGEGGGAGGGWQLQLQIVISVGIIFHCIYM